MSFWTLLSTQDIYGNSQTDYVLKFTWLEAKELKLMSADKNKCCHSETLTTFDNTVVEKGSSDVSCVYDENQIHRLRKKHVSHAYDFLCQNRWEHWRNVYTRSPHAHVRWRGTLHSTPSPPYSPCCSLLRDALLKKNGMKCNENPSALFANNVWADVYRRARMQVEGSLGEKKCLSQKEVLPPLKLLPPDPLLLTVWSTLFL